MEHSSSILSPKALSREDNTEDKSIEKNTQQHELNPPPFASISLSISLPSLLLQPPKPASSPSSLSPFVSHLKIPSQISSLALSTGLVRPNPRPSSRTPGNFSSLTPLQSPSPFLRRRTSDPSAGATARRTSIVWFRTDLRLHDNEALASAHSESSSILPVFLFDPRGFGKSAAGFDRTGPYRAHFLVQSVADLRSSLRARGSDLVVRIGKPETVLVELAKAVGADTVYAHRDVSSDEVKTEERVEKVMEAEGIEAKYFWGSTLYHIDDLPFDLERMPTNYGGFRAKVKGVGVRKTIEVLEQVRGMPAQGDVEVGEVPSLRDLGLTPPPLAQDGKSSMSASLKGGETEALEKLRKFAAECHAQPKTERTNGTRDSIYGANFSCKISPWLASGCLSPRFMFDELKKTATRSLSASTQKKGTAGEDDGMNWLMFELLWRDFFRFITKKYSSPKRKTEAVPAQNSPITSLLIETQSEVLLADPQSEAPPAKPIQMHSPLTPSSNRSPSLPLLRSSPSAVVTFCRSPQQPDPPPYRHLQLSFPYLCLQPPQSDDYTFLNNRRAPPTDPSSYRSPP